MKKKEKTFIEQINKLKVSILSIIKSLFRKIYIYKYYVYTTIYIYI